MKYENVRSKLDTLDQLFFSKKGPISNIIKIATFSKWSHVGSVLKIRGKLYCWESTTMNKTRTINGKIEKGVQVTPLRKRIAEYDGKVAFRRIHINRDLIFLQNVSDFKKKVDGVRYEENYWELFKSAFDIGRVGKNKENFDTIFCSELNAEALKVGNVIYDHVPSNEYTPEDFAGDLAFKPGNYFIDKKPILIEV